MPLYPPTQGSQGSGYIPWTPHQFPAPSFTAEFDEGSVAAMEAAGGWSKVNFAAINAADVDVYSSFAGGDPRVNINGQRPSWLRLQPPADATFYGWSKAVAPGVNWAAVMRGIINHRVLSVVNNDGCLMLSVHPDNGSGQPDLANSAEIYIGETDTGALSAQASRTVAGVVTNIAEGGNEQSSGMDITWVGMQKVGSTLHFWCMADSNNSVYFGSYALPFTIAHICFLARNVSAAAPGNMVVGVDWIRMYDGSQPPW